jgi:hypothetical protein
LKIRALWDIVLCSLVGVDQRFRDAFCLHAHLKCRSTPRLHSIIFQKAQIFTLAAIRTWNLTLLRCFIMKIAFKSSISLEE